MPEQWQYILHFIGVLIRGLVSCIKHGPSAADNVYYVLHENAQRGLQLSAYESKLVLECGEGIDCEFEGQLIENFSESPGAQGALGSLVSAWIEENLNAQIKDSGISDLDIITKAMNGKLRIAAKIFARKLAFGSPIIIRFHNDADGSSGAYALYKSLEKFFEKDLFGARPKLIWKMHRGVTYSEIDAEEDMLTLGNYASFEKPLLLVIDFGTSQGTNAGIQKLSDAFDIIWLDHHPLESEANVKDLEHYVSPWNFKGESSYTAGFLACQFSRFFYDDMDLSHIEDASMIGDYSKYARNTQLGRRTATILDLLTSDKTIAFGTRNYLTPSEIDQVLLDEVKSTELYTYALSKLDESIDSALKSMKHYGAAKGDIYLVDFDAIRDPMATDRFPLPGRFASKLLDKIDVDAKPRVLILHFGKFISMRVGNGAKEIVDVSKLAREMKEHNENIESGGGHSSAGSIKLFDDEGKKELINEIINRLKEKLS